MLSPEHVSRDFTSVTNKRVIKVHFPTTNRPLPAGVEIRYSPSCDTSKPMGTRVFQLPFWPSRNLPAWSLAINPMSSCSVHPPFGSFILFYLSTVTSYLLLITSLFSFTYLRIVIIAVLKFILLILISGLYWS